MSQCLNFFVEGPDGKDVHLIDYSRNTHIYKAFEGFPYGKMRMVRGFDFDVAEHNLNKEIKQLEDSLDTWDKTLDGVREIVANNIVEKVFDIISTMKSIKEEIDELKNALVEINFLGRIESPLYAGIEVILEDEVTF